MSAPRLCACGCGAVLDGRPNRDYISAAHRQRAWKEKHGYRVVGSRRATEVPQIAANPSQRRFPKRSGRQISYRKAVRVLAAHLASELPMIVKSLDDWAALVDEGLQDALPENQR